MRTRTVSVSRRVAAGVLAALVAGVTLVPLDADARAGRGGSFGSRGSKTFSAPPPTATAPGAAPIQRSTTQPGAATNAPGTAGQTSGQTARRPGFFGGGLGAGLMGGLLGAGLFGLLSGAGLFGGLGSLASILGLLIQVALIVVVARLALGWWRRRQQPALAAAGPAPVDYRFDRVAGGGSGSGGAPAAAVAALVPEPGDFDAFERLLSDVQDGWSRQDLARLRTLATPEMVEIFADDLAEDASRGVVNRVTDVKLLQGDLAESWREGDRDYATVAMRYAMIDVTMDAATDQVVDGDPSATVEATELWTFLRVRGGRWLLSAIQQQG